MLVLFGRNVFEAAETKALRTKLIIIRRCIAPEHMHGHTEYDYKGSNARKSRDRIGSNLIK